MSISTQKQSYPEITREAAVPRATIKKVMAKTVNIIKDYTINLLMVVFSIFSGAGEIVGNSFSWKWYGLFFMIILIFFIEKFNILKKFETTIITGENFNKPNIDKL